MKAVAIVLICLFIGHIEPLYAHVILTNDQGESTGQPLYRTLWIDEYGKSNDWSKIQFVLAREKNEIDRIIVPILLNGRTQFLTKSKMFRQSPLYRAAPQDPFAVVLKQAHDRGIRVYASLDVLRWTLPGTNLSQDILRNRPELIERDLEGRFGPTASLNLPSAPSVANNFSQTSKYVSFASAEVHANLKDFVTEVAARYPTVDGLVLRCSYPSNIRLAYSEPSRAAYIRHAGYDPVDLKMIGTPDELKQGQEWTRWRINQVTKLVNSLSSAFRSKHYPNRQVAAVADPVWHRSSLGARGASCSDWVEWISSGAVDEVLFEADWVASKNKGAESFAILQTRQKKLKAAVSWILNGYASAETEANPKKIANTFKTQDAKSFVLRTR